jgi:septum formation protein
MDSKPLPVVLASRSPRRRELLERASLRFEIQVRDVDETPEPGESPVQLAVRLAKAKAEAVAADLDSDALVLGADTIVVLGETILGKPTDDEDAARMLRMLSGNCHEVITAFAITVAPAAQLWSTRSVHTKVYFRDLTEAVIERYVATGEPLDKAGGYGIQGLGVQLVARTEGSYSNVVGLPLVEVLECLARMGGPEL